MLISPVAGIPRLTSAHNLQFKRTCCRASDGSCKAPKGPFRSAGAFQEKKRLEQSKQRSQKVFDALPRDNFQCTIRDPGGLACSLRLAARSASPSPMEIKFLSQASQCILGLVKTGATWRSVNLTAGLCPAQLLLCLASSFQRFSCGIRLY